MNKGLIACAVLLIVAGLSLIFLSGRDSSSQSKTPMRVEQEKTPSLDASKTIERSGKTVLSFTDKSGAPKEKPLNDEEKSFVTLTKSFLDFAGTNKGPGEFIGFLQGLGLKPVVARDEQELIEDLTLIRTENTLPGVRYINAQFDGDGVQELQHLSFEIKKGERAFEDAIQLAENTLGLGERMKDTDPNMAIYKSGGYVIWLKKLTWEDMMGDPVNAYEPSDVGNVRVAIERDIHPHESEHGHEH